LLFEVSAETKTYLATLLYTSLAKLVVYLLIEPSWH